MGRKKQAAMPGLRQRNGVWHIEKIVFGTRLYESTGTSHRREAEQYLAHRIEQLRLNQLYGVRPQRTFDEAATKYLAENQHKRSIDDEVDQIAHLKPYIGHCPLDKLNMLQLQPFIAARQQQGVKNRTVNYALQVTRRILKLACDEWVDESNLTWLAAAPKIKLLPQTDERQPYPLTWEEQDDLFALLPPYLRRMALFKVNTGLRDQEVCALRWEWEYPIPELNTSLFVVPALYSKNKLDRVVVLNEIALQVITDVRGHHPIYVFKHPEENTRVFDMNTTSWQNARKKLNLPVRIHDLKHTFGRRLRAANVSEEDRRDLLGHKSQRITTHYSAAEIRNLIDAANKACIRQTSTPTLGRVKVEKVEGLSLTIAERMQARQRANRNDTGNTFRQNSGKAF
jgi:integrase